MPNKFNMNDIFEIAVRIEKNGAVFYRNAAKKINDEQNKKFLLDLAEMEDDHSVTFSNMQKELKIQETMTTDFDPDDENLAYLKTLADTRIFLKNDQPDESLQHILTTAIQTEKDSIAFYLGMKELVPANSGKEKINDIIKEEMNHIKILAEKLKE